MYYRTCPSTLALRSRELNILGTIHKKVSVHHEILSLRVSSLLISIVCACAASGVFPEDSSSKAFATEANVGSKVVRVRGRLTA